MPSGLLLAAVLAAFCGVAPVGAAASPPRVVVIVGPVGALTDEYRAAGAAAVAEARRWTADVTAIMSPDATWPRVRGALQGASVVIYLGHGNGWPSPYTRALSDATENGFGLNPIAGHGDDAHQYFGAAVIARDVRLAPGAVVLLHRLCYASGNGEPGAPEGTVDVARQRVDNFAAGFLAAGAGVVVADAFAAPSSYLRAILGQGLATMVSWRASATANGHVQAFASARSPGALGFLDPETATSGYYRSIVLGPAIAAQAGAAGPGTGPGAGVPGGVPALLLLPSDPPRPPSLAALGVAVPATPSFADRPVAGASNTVVVPLAIPAGVSLPAGLKVGFRWTLLDSQAAAGAPSAPGPDPGAQPAGQSPAPTAASTVGPGGPAARTAPRGSAPTPAAVASPAPTVSPAPLPSAGPTPSASNGAAADVDALLAGPDAVVPERASTVVDVVPATVDPAGIRAAVTPPPVPGRYRLVLTLHGADGVALDAATQALIPALLVRVAGPVGVSYAVPARAQVVAGGHLAILVSVTNTGTLAWGGQFADPAEGGPRRPMEPARLVGHWLALGDDPDLTAPSTLASTPVGVAPGATVALTLDVTAPTRPGAWLLLVDVVSPMFGSLAARGIAPAMVLVTVFAAP